MEIDRQDAAHLAVLTDTIRGAEFSVPQPVTVAGLAGVQQIGVNDELNLTIIATSRTIVRGEFLDTFVYTRSDEYAANLPLINAVMETVRYLLATE